MTRDPIRVPGFLVADSDDVSDSAHGPTDLSARTGARQLNVRVLVPLHDRYKRLLRDLEDQDFNTSMSEVVQALLHGGPLDAEEAKRIVRAWRRALDPDL